MRVHESCCYAHYGNRKEGRGEPLLVKEGTDDGPDQGHCAHCEAQPLASLDRRSLGVERMGALLNLRRLHALGHANDAVEKPGQRLFVFVDCLRRWVRPLPRLLKNGRLRRANLEEKSALLPLSQNMRWYGALSKDLRQNLRRHV